VHKPALLPFSFQEKGPGDEFRLKNILHNISVHAADFTFYFAKKICTRKKRSSKEDHSLSLDERHTRNDNALCSRSSSMRTLLNSYEHESLAARRSGIHRATKPNHIKCNTCMQLGERFV